MQVLEGYQSVPMVRLDDLSPYHKVTQANKKQPFPNMEEISTPGRIDLSQVILKDPANTYFVFQTLPTMEMDGIFHGDLLVVDRAITPKSGQWIVVYFEGEFTVLKLYIKNDQITLKTDYPEIPPVVVEPDMTFSVWGVVVDHVHQKFIF